MIPPTTAATMTLTVRSQSVAMVRAYPSREMAIPNRFASAERRECADMGRPTSTSPALPMPRGPLSAHVIDALGGQVATAIAGVASSVDALDDDDLQLALYLCY